MKPEQNEVTRKVYQVLLGVYERLCDVVCSYPENNVDEERLAISTAEIEALCNEYPWLRDLAD